MGRRANFASIGRRIAWLAVGTIATGIVGCAKSSLESEVRGTVTLDGRSIGPGMIVFSPVEPGKPATGSIAQDGGYDLKTSREFGLAPGKYRVAVSLREMPANFDPAARLPPGKLLIPEKYEESSTSGLEFDVAPGSNTIDIPLVSDAATGSSQ